MENTSPQSKGTSSVLPRYSGLVNETDVKIIHKLNRILERGNNAEVKRKKDGTVAVYEVKKSIV